MRVGRLHHRIEKMLYIPRIGIAAILDRCRCLNPWMLFRFYWLNDENIAMSG